MSIFKTGPFNVPYEVRRIGQNGSSSFICVSPSGLAYDFNASTAGRYKAGTEQAYRARALTTVAYIGEPVEQEPVFAL